MFPHGELLKPECHMDGDEADPRASDGETADRNRSQKVEPTKKVKYG